jgi:hypothetical protein
VEDVRGAAGPFEDLEVIRSEAEMPVSRFCELIGIPRRSYVRQQARARSGATAAKGPLPAPVVDAVPAVATYAADWPAWGHRKIHRMMAADGHDVSRSSAERAMRRRGLPQRIDCQGERRELVKAPLPRLDPEEPEQGRPRVTCGMCGRPLTGAARARGVDDCRRRLQQRTALRPSRFDVDQDTIPGA